MASPERRASISLVKYSYSSVSATMWSISMSGSAVPTAASDHVRNCSQSSGGAPIISAISRVGRGAAISSANSWSREVSTPSRMPLTISRTFGSSKVTWRRVKPALMSLRSCRCRGGSVKMRLPSCTGSGWLGSGMVIPFVDVNRPGLPDTKRTSSYLVSAQNFVTSFHTTGVVARSSRYVGYGSPA